MSKDIHKRPFDDGTKAKLSIFKDYLKEWLPVFLARKEIIWKTINIFDFFAGPGSDSTGHKGTPLIIIEELIPYLEKINQKKLTVNLYFNEYNKTKYHKLKERLLQENQDSNPYFIDVESHDFKVSFDKQFNRMNNDCANLLFLDQNGIKHINEDVFIKIINLKTTDFLFFISSSTIKRFSEHPNIAQHIKLSPEEVEKTPYHRIHRLILDYYKSLIPKNKIYYLASFSLRKNSGVYGLIFGSGHVLGIEKFLTTCWNIDPARGEANFDIDDDKIMQGQIDLFTGTVRKPKKVDLFEKELKEKILNQELRNDKEIYLFTLSNGFTPIHTRKVINNLIADKKISKCKLDLSSKICKTNASLTEIKFN
ncbi:MAG: three-Cys-motif partner protein TcmP [Cyclobacteriaceae bacterium]